MGNVALTDAASFGFLPTPTENGIILYEVESSGILNFLDSVNTADNKIKVNSFRCEERNHKM